ncbi:CusA/CzcA family heavy metal efflux RND transporter [Sphingobacterium spiritivorum]|nr:CusA/CzcA family heavy metal efflux RND transporter [Sphingobacterium spiritivorum]QQS95735.1 CusA/CzcA family heavy metal efflux RND transporter [Sphingobacterium spiritivorum]
MLNAIIRFSIRNKIVIGLFTLILIIWGVWSAMHIPIDANPDITNNQVQIITRSPSLATQEVEQFVSYPIEQQLMNIPDLIELRSISRFGLSVVTAVFDDDVNIYFARQLINEKLNEAVQNIPEGMGTPELAPISTGLGEIYQYVLHPAKGAEDKYSAADLRTLQDWLIARQLYGTPGVAEVNSFGGKLKQYEVSIDPYRLRAMNLGINDVFNALEANNQNTGGAYIDKKPNAYFIRGVGLLSDMEDIRNTVIRKRNGVPVYIRDVAQVREGSAVRYGALTYNGEKEAVGGIVLMLKGSNSAQVVGAVKEKLKVIEKSLPKDVVIEAFSDRTQLVNRAINTVQTNLIEGALIVIFVLIIFLGNLRAGLIVASAIPISMLFALGMMRMFGVSANLMSLGAIDFGLIIDGSLIIVEATMHHLGLRKSNQPLTQAEMDEEVYQSSSKIRNSAAFGEIIILIVYIPILTLVGIEGKMFKPMAQTVSFAIIGALILSLTYIPMMSALFLSKKPHTKVTFADRLMNALQRWYQPLIKKAVRIRKVLVAAAVAVFAFSIFLFSKMGSEFIPQLKEGDYAFHCILPQGASLAQSIETSMEAARILKKFPEVKTVVGKTGSAEIPTDPMPPEATDLIVTLKPIKEWTGGDTYTGLANRMMDSLSVIPGTFFEASQPIQMRFNELMTGVRQDVAVKIFGENIDTLASLASKVGQVVQSVDGASEPQVERTTGLPQISIEYNRAQLGLHGLTVSEINKMVSMAFAGSSAGSIYENERRFDLVVRLDSNYKTSIEDVRNLPVVTGEGEQVPLSQLADISMKDGPAQISREDGKRRVVIGFNIKGRDVTSVVNDIQTKLNELNILPTGYYYTFGGTFENLKEASNRLMIAVPVALLLIFMLLYFTFRSIKESILIYTAIPMSAIGGIFALLLRDMPFSISAGVGFIALFGVAVLNGIVLISTFNQLEKEGVHDVFERVWKGTTIRLRPVLMTATVASLGFLPMALSTGAGAEVQKPLATVVIGGLISATLLTLFVLPSLYVLFFNKSNKMNGIATKTLPLILAIMLFVPAQQSFAQQGATRITLESAIKQAMTANLDIKKTTLQADKFKVESAKTFDGKTGIFVENEDMAPLDPQGIWKVGVSQNFNWPGFYKARKAYLSKNVEISAMQLEEIKARITRDVSTNYYELTYLEARQRLFQQLDSIYQELFRAADLRVQTGEAAGLERIAAETKWQENKALLIQNHQDLLISAQNLSVILNQNTFLLPNEKELIKISFNKRDITAASHPLVRIQEKNVELAEAGIRVEKKGKMPDFSGRVFSQRLWGQKNPFTGFSVTANFPVFSSGYYNNKVKAAQLESDIQQQGLLQVQQVLSADIQNAENERIKNEGQLQFYETSGLKQAEAIIKAANLGYQSGEISYAELSQFLTQSIDIKINYLNALNAYNKSVVNYQYFQTSINK